MFKSKMNLFGWVEAESSDYQLAYQQLGGNFSTHPDALAFQHQHADLQPRYFVSRNQDHRLQGALCTWRDKTIANAQATRGMLQGLGIPVPSDELLLPLDRRIILPVYVKTLSAMHAEQVINSSVKMNARRELCLAKGLGDGGFSRKAKYSRRRELNQFLEAGGAVRPHSDFSAAELMDIYFELYYLRRGEYPLNKALNVRFAEELRDHIFGNVLFFKGEPCAFQLIVMAESPRWITFDYINIGVDQRLSDYSPGSILSWVNISEAWELCQAKGKVMRYSFGNPTAGYKDQWCYRESLRRVWSV
ncbi:GNAT family N-acetyltransferase [Erwinia sp. V71]|uniref:GNAT family N-acetyltransferase n=1 Tax=Erwinia sp. V71 TaxID=3369424 RepID=UPI003F60B49B